MKNSIITFSLQILFFSFTILLGQHDTKEPIKKIEFKEKTYKIKNKKKLDEFIYDFIGKDFDLKKIMKSKMAYNKDGNFHMVEATGYDSEFNVKKIIIPIIPKDEKNILFETDNCFHHCYFKNTDTPTYNNAFIITRPCREQSCGDGVQCSITAFIDEW